MSPRSAILILLVFAILGSSVMGFLYIQQQKVLKQEIIPNNKEEIVEIVKEKEYIKGTEEYYRYLVDEINRELEREKMENGSVSMDSKKIAVDKINDVLKMKYNDLSPEARLQRDLAVQKKQKEVRKINEEILRNNK